MSLVTQVQEELVRQGFTPEEAHHILHGELDGKRVVDFSRARQDAMYGNQNWKGKQ